MKQNINLSLGRKKVDHALQKIFILSAAFFIVSVLISIGLIMYGLVLKTSYAALEQKEANVDTQLLSLQEKKIKLTEVKSRLADIKKIIAKRSPTTSRIGLVSGVLPPEATINSLSGSSHTVDINLESDSLASLNELIESKITEFARSKKGGIKKVEMNGFALNARTLNYSVTLSIEYN